MNRERGGDCGVKKKAETNKEKSSCRVAKKKASVLEAVMRRILWHRIKKRCAAPWCKPLRLPSQEIVRGLLLQKKHLSISGADARRN